MQAVRVAAAAGLRLRRLPPDSAAAMAAAMTSSFVPTTARPAAALPSSLSSTSPTSPSPSPSAFAPRVRIHHARLPRLSVPERRGGQRLLSSSRNVASCPCRLFLNVHQLCFRRPAVTSASTAAAGGSETAVHEGVATAEAEAIQSSSSSGSPDDNGHATPAAPPADSSAQNGAAEAGAGAGAPAKEEKGGKQGGGKGGKGKGGSGGGGKGGKGKAGADAAATSSSSKEAIRALRIQKVEELRKAEHNPYAYGFARSHRAAQLQRDYAQLQDGEEAGGGVEVRVAGRVVAKRVMGKLAFLTLRDEDTTVQLFCMSARMEDAQAGSFAALKSSVDVGDIVGAVGGVKRTERGELSVVPTQVSILTKSLLPLPDKWHGLTDVETRYRQRYLDMIVNPEVAGVFRARAKIVSVIRRRMEDLGFVEVETPVLQADAGGAEARPFITHHNALGQDMYLRIATELHLKRMIVGGFDRVFEMGRIFRNEGISTRHNPEFTSIEMYQAYADYSDMMDLVEALVEESALALHGTTTVAYQGTDINLARPWRRASMDGLVKEATGVDFIALRDANASLEDVRAAAETALEATLANDRKALAGAKRKVAGAPSWGHVLNEVFEAAVEKSLVQPTLVMDHPVDISPLAKPHRSRPGLTERFELFVCGRELANAFSELTDPLDQRARLEEQVKAHELKRAAAAAHKQDGNSSSSDGGGSGGEVDDDEDYDVRVDEDFVTALEYGMPPTAGMGIGVDRLVMLLTDSPSIRDVIAFPVLRQQQQQQQQDGKVPEDKPTKQ